MPRIHVIGSGGAGKTVLAARLADALDLPHIELDSLFWGENWQPAETEIFQQAVRQALAVDDWATDGNYSKVREIVWGRAEVVVWLDYPLGLVMWRLLRRSLRRALSGELLWGRNQESLANLFLAQDSLLRYVLRTYKPKQTLYRQLFESPQYAGIEFVRLQSPRQTEAWLQNFIQLQSK